METIGEPKWKLYRRRAWAITRLVAVCAIILVLIAGLMTYVNKQERLDHATANIPATLASASDSNRSYHTMLMTVKHDGHTFIVSSDGGILHHPDCPCLKTSH